MKPGLATVRSAVALLIAFPAVSLAASFTMPATLTAGEPFTVSTSGTGDALFYLVGPNQTLTRKITLGQDLAFSNGTVIDAGEYLAILSQGSSNESEAVYVAPAATPAHISFLALPSRLPVNLPNAVTGAVYVYDAYHNLITAPKQVSFSLSTPSSAGQSKTVQTREGAAWTAMNSTPKEGAGQFIAKVGDVSSMRIVQQVPGTACNLTITAQQQPNGRLLVKTSPVHDCSGNPVPDGTVVSFTQTYRGGQSIADVPLKNGVAQVEFPARGGATLSAASGVALGNEIRWGR